MAKVFIIAEAACTWLHAGLEGAYRSIRAAAECGASAWKTQFTSSPSEMGKRRGMDGSKYERLNWDPAWLPKLKAECDRVGIEFMCTVFIPKDIPIIAPYVSRFKVSAFEFDSKDFVKAHAQYGREVILSRNPDALHDLYEPAEWMDYKVNFKVLHCISKYPTKLEELRLAYVRPEYEYPSYDGLSDHSCSTLTGAVAVGAGAAYIEKHVRLSDTPSSDPDYGHSLVLDKEPCFYCLPEKWCNSCSSVHGGSFAEYVANVRLAERML